MAIEHQRSRREHHEQLEHNDQLEHRDRSRSRDQQLHDARAAAGRKGGKATLDRHGRSFFSRIGRIGGKKRTGAKHAR